MLEEAEENRINSREQMMTKIKKEFSQMTRTLSFKNAPPPSELPSLSDDSVIRMVDSVANGAKFAMTDALAILHAVRAVQVDSSRC